MKLLLVSPSIESNAPYGPLLLNLNGVKSNANGINYDVYPA